MSYRKIGELIRLVDERNKDLQVVTLVGLTIHKKFIPSVANTIGTDMKNYKIIRRNQFACSTMQVRRDKKMPVALLKELDVAILSPAYPVFEVKDENEVLPDYLMLWFTRSEFDREACFHAVGGVRGSLEWEDFCNMELPIPSIEKQREIVAQYQAVENKIRVNKQICEKLEATAQALYKHWFVDFEFPNEDGKPYKSSGGKMVWNEELEKEIPEGWEVGTLKDYANIKGGKRLPKDSELNKNKVGRPYIRVADMNKNKFMTINSEFMFVDDITQKEISRYTVDTNDVIISIVGTIGLVNVIDESLNKANLTENCFKLTNLKKINKDYLYHYLVSERGQREIEMKTVGGVQAKLPMYNVELLDLLIPSTNLLSQFESTVKAINQRIVTIIKENDKLTELQSLLLSRLARLEG
ncbi:restriction endonuclease subunit S [Sphingobacterium thermophilum]|uniref:Type I restriction modification DNA specificity domain-containing protein n=1 Tax=Sphingobacterium thermophilum TaxID=768534 RepID=A0ABP8R3C1_9SPHI